MISLSLVAMPAVLTAATGQIPAAFEDRSDLLDFVHRSTRDGGLGLGGAAWLDYDRDGDLDLYLPNGRANTNALYQNDGKGNFVNVAGFARVKNGLGNGAVVAADFDNDGWTDLLLGGDGDSFVGTWQGPLKLYRNDRNGRFTDVTDASGLVSPSSTFDVAVADVDNDGDLDLFFTGPGNFILQDVIRNELWRNDGDLAFTNVSVGSGVDTNIGACAAIFMDYDDDGWMDLLIGNCSDPVFVPTPVELHRNNGTGDMTFTDMTPTAGTDVPGLWMGFGVADYDHDGDMDVFATSSGNSGGGSLWHALFRNTGQGGFEDVALAAGAGNHRFAWGCSFTDFDNDGYDDLYFAGALAIGGTGTIGPGRGNPGTMLFNQHNGTFAEFTSEMPVNLENRYTSGVAYGDYDDDGFTDLLVIAETIPQDVGRPVLLRNTGTPNNWIKITLEGTTSNRDAIGARVRVIAGDLAQTKGLYAGSSFMSTDSFVLTFGLAKNDATEFVQVRWPSGLVEDFANLPAGGRAHFVEGTSSCCVGDVDRNGTVDTVDLLAVLSAWGECPDPPDPCPADFDGSGTVDFGDVLVVIANWS